jgi:uncharacterized MAPEG superfamily protein
VAKFSGPGFNNRRPRDFQESLAGWRKRAHWAHQNSFEAFPVFAAAVLVAQQAGAAQGRVDQLALAFIGLRLLYGVFYIGDWHALRSLAWALAMACVVGMFLAAA